MCVSVSVHPNLHLCVCALQLKRAITFDSLGKPLRNFQGLIYFLHVPFGWVIWIPGP